MDRRPAPTLAVRERGISVFFVLLVGLLVLSAMPTVSSLTITPARQQLTNPSDEVYQYVYTVTNDDPVPHTLSLRPERNSEYFSERTTFQPQQFSLLPGASENVKVSVSPAGLGPQTHTLAVGAYDAETQVARFELLVTVPGTPIEKYDVAVSVEDILSDQSVPVDLVLRNYGNVIGYAQARLEILRGEEVVGQIEYPDLLQVLPNKDTAITLTYNDHLDPGFYTARVVAQYPNQVVNATKPFSVSLGMTRRVIELHSDLELSFKSLGNPPIVVYSLSDSRGIERLSGSFFPDAGDIIIPTSTLPAGMYTLSLRIRGATQTTDIVIRDASAKYRTLAIVLVFFVALLGLFSVRRQAAFQWRVLLLKRAIRQRERAVDNLINRAHKLVDEYAAHAARADRTTASSGEQGQRP